MTFGHLRVPHGWWFPELLGSVDGAGAHEHNDGMLIDDADEHLDREQGIPQLKGFAGRIERLDGPPAHIADVQHLADATPAVFT